MTNYRVYYNFKNLKYRLYFSAETVETDQDLKNIALFEIGKFHEGVTEEEITRVEKRVRR
jgi:hypothetical protein